MLWTCTGIGTPTALVDGRGFVAEMGGAAPFQRGVCEHLESRAGSGRGVHRPRLRGAVCSPAESGQGCKAPIGKVHFGVGEDWAPGGCRRGVCEHLESRAGSGRGVHRPRLRGAVCSPAESGQGCKAPIGKVHFAPGGMSMSQDESRTAGGPEARRSRRCGRRGWRWRGLGSGQSGWRQGRRCRRREPGPRQGE